MKIEDQLLAEGFVEYNDVFSADKEYYIKSYQLKVKDAVGKRYFININLYDYNNADCQYSLPPYLLEDLQGVYEVQFHLEDGNTFDVNYPAESVKEAVALFDKMFYVMGCSYYEES